MDFYRVKIADFSFVSKRILQNKRAELTVSWKNFQITQNELDVDVDVLYQLKIRTVDQRCS